MIAPSGMRSELERIRRVSDQLCSGHAGLRDRYLRRAVVLDLLILAASTWLVALSFVAPSVNKELAPFGIQPNIWVGVLGTATFFLTIVQIKTDWKSRADAHRRTLEMYAEVKREAGYMLANEVFDELDFRRVLSRYDLVSAVGVEIPESEFLRQKKRHKMKVELSRYLDDSPFSSLSIVRFKLWVRDNFRRDK